MKLRTFFETPMTAFPETLFSRVLWNDESRPVLGQRDCSEKASVCQHVRRVCDSLRGQVR